MTSPAIQLYPYQKRWLADQARFKIGMFARQTGKTFTTTLEIVDDCMAAFVAGRRERWVILSRGERQAREAMEEGIKRHAAAYRLGFEYQETEVEFGAERVTQLEVTLPGGSRITALPANPDTARGFSANVFLDEFAFHQDSHAIWKALFPVISNGFRLRVTSTPNGKGNKFHELMTANDSVWSRHTVNIEDAVRDGLPRDIPMLKAGIADEDAWSQEYMLEWLDEASAWLSYELISTVEHELAGRPDLYQGGPCYLGVDIGRRQDLYVQYLLELVGDVLWERERVELRRATFAQQDEALDDAFQRYRILRCCMDQTGMGEKPVEDAQKRHGALRVEGVLMTAPNQLTMATHAKEQFEDRKLRIAQGVPALRSDLHKIKKIVGPTGIPRFVAERDAGGHADRAWALFLALAAADNPITPMEHRSSGQLRRAAGLQDFIRGAA
jgi:phage FluMu gp28-like protein